MFVVLRDAHPLNSLRGLNIPQMAVQPLDMRLGTEAALARVVGIFGAAHPHHAYPLQILHGKADHFLIRTRRRLPVALHP
ncbi:hypothetical protein [Paucibacter sp. XJ19-41]|uniref:hypothetical protein n=1 Tax=Paucibacter sp. XJ19-41 TaxID=2927824 RepID=UPI00234AB4D1|nr:hypothetical protein [Paucibacter sp. XJ19-41]MDC6166483.1 hypothetical protein [Paucibacter sp. XJ19-41]